MIGKSQAGLVRMPGTTEGYHTVNHQVRPDPVIMSMAHMP